MQVYEIPLVPGPTSVPREVRAAYQVDYGSADLEPEFIKLYADTQAQLQQIMGTANQIALFSGEGMVALWGALKSCLRPATRCWPSPPASSATASATWRAPSAPRWRPSASSTTRRPTDMDRIEAAIRRFRPKMVTLVHCETPSGTMNPAAEVGTLVRRL